MSEIPPTLASKKVVRDKTLFSCPDMFCQVVIFVDTPHCPVCKTLGIKLRDPLPEHK